MNRILFVTGNLDRGGAQRVISILANEYALRGWDVHIALLLDFKIGYTIDKMVSLHDVSQEKKNITGLMKWIKELRKVIIEVSPDVIVSFVGRINIVTTLSTIGMKIPLIVSERNDPANDRRSQPERLLCKILYSKADRVIFQTDYQAKYYKRWCKNNFQIIGNPIQAKEYRGKHPIKDILCVGKLMDQKNHPMIIRAFREISCSFPEKQVWIYGDGPQKQEIEDMILSYGLEKKIHLAGNTDNIFDVMHDFEYFVLCSNYEGLSNALLEAMISGMVCISTNWSGIESIIEDKKNGYITKIKDSSALAKVLEIAFTVDNSNLVKKGIETGKRFYVTNIIEEWDNCIKGTMRK